MVVRAKSGPFGRVIARIGRLGSLDGIITNHQGLSIFEGVRNVAMKKISTEISLDQRKNLDGKLQSLIDENITKRSLQDAKSLDQIFERTLGQIDRFVSPDAVAFVRNLGPKLELEKAFRLSVPEKALSLASPSSPAVYSVAKGLSVYIADLKKGPVMFANANDEVFIAAEERSGIKINRSLGSVYRALAVVPILMKGSDVPLGLMEVLWKRDVPADRFDCRIDLEVLRRLGGFVGPALFTMIARQNVNDLPPDLKR